MAFLHHDDSNALIIELRSKGLTDQEVLTLYLINEWDESGGTESEPLH
jgi:hypothetical protein